MCEYNQVEGRADTAFCNAVIKLEEAIACLQDGIACNKEGYAIWCQITKWLCRYYERFGNYGGWDELKCEFDELVTQMICKEWESLECAQNACCKLKETRECDRKLQCVKQRMQDGCFPKC